MMPVSYSKSREKIGALGEATLYPELIIGLTIFNLPLNTMTIMKLIKEFKIATSIFYGDLFCFDFHGGRSFAILPSCVGAIAKVA